MHDRVADRGHLDDAVADRSRPRPRPRRPAPSTASRTARGHLAVAAGIEHDVGDAAHQVFAEADLRVHHAGRGERLAGGEVGRDARRSWSSRYRRRRRRCASTRPGQTPTMSRPWRTAAVTFHCAGAQRLLQRREDRHAARASSMPHCVAERVGEAAEVARRVVHVGLGDLDIVEGARPDRGRSARLSAALRTTWRWTWLSAGTSTTTSPQSCAWQPSRRPGFSAPRISA